MGGGGGRFPGNQETGKLHHCSLIFINIMNESLVVMFILCWYFGSVRIMFVMFGRFEVIIFDPIMVNCLI